MATASSESFADSSRAGIVERHVLGAQSPMHLAESAVRSAAVGSSLQCTLGAEINKQFQLLFVKTLLLKLHYIVIIVVSSR